MSFADFINVLISGDATGAKAAMLEAQAAVEEGTAGISSSFEAMGGIIEGAMAPLIAITAAFVALHEITETIHKTVELAQSLQILSEKTGISVEELSALKYAAHLSEVEMDTLTVGLQRLARGMEEAAKTGKGPASDAFRDLGVHASTANGQLRPFRDVLLDLSTRFQHMPDGPRKTALAMDLFGRSGANLIPMLNKGKDGIEELEAEARKLGATMSGDAVKSALEYEEATKRLHAVWDGFLRTIVVDALPVLEKLVQLLSAVVHAATAAYHAVAGMQALFQLRFGAAKEHLDAWVAAIKAIPGDFTLRTPAQASGEGSAPPIDNAKAHADQLAEALARMKYQWQFSRETLLQGEVNFWADEMKHQKKGTDEYRSAYLKWLSSLEALNAFEHEKMNKNEEAWRNVLGNVVGTFRKAMDQMIQSGGGLKAFWRALWYDMVSESAAAGLQMVVNWAAHELRKTIITKIGTTEREEISAAAVLKTIALKMWEGIQWIAIEAAKAAASAWAAMSSIPIIGPALGVAAAIATFAGVMALAGKLHSAMNGFDVPSNMNPITQLHSQEMVLPKEYANVIRGMANGGGGGGGDTHVWHISTMDSASFEVFARKHGGIIYRAAIGGATAGKHIPGMPGRGPG